MVYSYKKSFESLIQVLVGRAPCVIAFKLLDEEADLLYFVSVPACVDRTSSDCSLRIPGAGEVTPVPGAAETSRWTPSSAVGSQKHRPGPSDPGSRRSAVRCCLRGWKNPPLHRGCFLGQTSRI